MEFSRLEANYEEPTGRRETAYSIRGLQDWDQVYQTLEDCCREYLGDKGWAAKVKKGWRELSDNIGQAQQALNLVPDVSYITPIRGTINLLFEVCQIFKVYEIFILIYLPQRLSSEQVRPVRRFYRD